MGLPPAAIITKFVDKIFKIKQIRVILPCELLNPLILRYNDSRHKVYHFAFPTLFICSKESPRKGNFMLRKPITVDPRLVEEILIREEAEFRDRKSTRLNSSHTVISYAVFCLKKKKIKRKLITIQT